MENELIDEQAIFAEEGFIADVQVLLHNLLESKGVSRQELAERLGVSAARVSSLFSADPRNLTLRTVARVFNALGERCVLAIDHRRDQQDFFGTLEEQIVLSAAAHGASGAIEEMTYSNDNEISLAA